MKWLVFAPPPAPEERYPDDVTLIVDSCATFDYGISREDAVRAWEAFSDSMCAGWMMVHIYDAETICATVRNQCEVYDTDV